MQPHPARPPQPSPPQATRPKQPTAALLITLAWISIMGVIWLVSLFVLALSLTAEEAPELFWAHALLPVLLIFALGFIIVGWRRRRPVWFLPAAFVALLGGAAGWGAIILHSHLNY